MIFTRKQKSTSLKLYLGCAKPPFHPQHLEVLKNPDEWVWIDLFVKHPKVKQWDARKLSEVNNNSVEQIYASHLLEHFPQTEIRSILKTWFKKLRNEGIITLNVPDIVWAAQKIIEQNNGKKLKGYFTEFEGTNGLMSILYGSQVHAGEYHKAGFSKKFLKQLLTKTGFRKVDIKMVVDAHDVGVLIAKATK